ncbi:DUF998 domain-containing protein [Dactylosporangium roseum]|uniref:DUF998 domain-containing protein n=1 Tax=Dactylosporangium roseum TaxID=47989 RepID=A0ABY5Z8R6_9ACTN|nr:DUF998 domain-containing protein [Dactylosporangium roseum]UWZ38426.1 DUF998 domain-containing protein [Dactylosporangium roseum]
MRRDFVAPFALWSAATAPVLLIGGWTAAAALQPTGTGETGRYDSLHDTISALAGQGAAYRWVMTVALLGVGLCHCVTARGLRPLATAARVMLGAGGVATMLVAALPVPSTGESGAHQTAATFAFACLALWPALWRRPGGGPVQPSAPVMLGGALLLVVLVFGFAIALGTGTLVGLAERIASGAEVTWPLVTVLLLRRHAGQPAVIP